jgi:hypothetical protein
MVHSTALQRFDPSPSYNWAKLQPREDTQLQAAYRAAIEDRADTLADDIIPLADIEPPAHLEGPTPKRSNPLPCVSVANQK